MQSNGVVNEALPEETKNGEDFQMLFTQLALWVEVLFHHVPFA